MLSFISSCPLLTQRVTTRTPCLILSNLYTINILKMIVFVQSKFNTTVNFHNTYVGHMNYIDTRVLAKLVDLYIVL